MVARKRDSSETAATVKHLTVTGLADRMGVPKKTVYQWNYSGTGPRYIRVGRGVRYRVTDVVAWENARLHGGTATA